MRKLRELIELFWANLEFFLDTKLELLFQIWILFGIVMLFPTVLVLFLMLLKVLNNL